MTRRVFLTYLLEAGAVAGLAVEPDANADQSVFVDVGLASAFKPGTVTRIVLPVTLNQEVVYVSAREHHAFMAWSARCTHKGCVVDWDGSEHRFVCPCHGGQFDEAGKNIAGPPSTPLRRLTAHQHQGRLLIEAPPPTNSSGD